MGIKLEKYDKKYRKKLKKLYLTSFPAEERAPFFLMLHKTKKGRSDMIIATENGEFAGFVYMVCHLDMAYIFYLAIDESKRGKGLGGAVLEALKSKYCGKRIFLAREQLDSSSKNYAQRVSRRNFYCRCGFEDMPCKIKEGAVVYDVMGIGGKITSGDYDQLIKMWAGKMLLKIVDMKLIEDQIS